MVQILKADGTFEAFQKSKIERTVLKAGGSTEFAKEVANNVAKNVREGTSTKQILEMTLRLLKKQPGIALKYDLKRAIMSLGPEGFVFEEFFSQVLQNYEYKTSVGITLKGKATTHEVDILAENSKRFMIECKYHNQLGNHTDSKVAMYTYARYLDLKNNPRNDIDQGWLVTNTKCTPHAIEYSKGVDLKITSWQYASKGEKNLQELISFKRLYPITLLTSVKGDIKEKLILARLLLVKDILIYNLSELVKKTRLNEKDIKRIQKEANEIFKEI